MQITEQDRFRKNSSAVRRDLIYKFDQFVDLFAKEISRYNPIPADSEIIHFLLNILSDIFEDGFFGSELAESEYDDSPHYWSKYSEVIDSDTMRFVNTLDQFSTDNEKAYVWILIELYNRNLLSIFKEVSSTPAIMSHYFPRSLMKKHNKDLLETLTRLSKIEYKIESKFLQNYEDHERGYYKQFNGFDSHNGVSESPPKCGSSGIHELKGKEINHKSSLDSPTMYPIQSCSLENTRTSSLFKSASSLKGRQEGTTEKGKDSLELYKDHAELPKFEGFSNFRSMEEIKAEAQEADALGGITPRWNQKRKTSRIRRSSSFQHLNFQAQDSTIQGEQMVISPLNYSNISPKSECPPLKESPSPLKEDLDIRTPECLVHDSPIPSDEEEFSVNCEPSNRRRLIIAGFSAAKSDLQSSYDTPIFRTAERPHPCSITPYSSLTHNPLKNSDNLFNESFKMIQQEFRYRERPTRQIKLEEQANKCYSCSQSLSRRFLFFWPRKGYCHYTGRWYCAACMAQEEFVIPWLAAENWDFRKYSVCKEAKIELLSLYEKPNILIDYKSPILEKNRILYDTLVARRQLHLMFDTICDTTMILALTKDNENLLLKQNLFSMRNLIEISRGMILMFLERCIAKSNSHIMTCKTCQNKGRVCEICNKEPKIFPFDIKNTAICTTCKHLYHRSCYSDKKCKICK